MSYDDLILNDEGRLCLPTGEPYTGATEDFYEDGQIMNRETFLNGVMH